MYQERQASFEGGVVWQSESDGGESLILPDGCIDVIWLDGRLVVAGPDAVGRTISGAVGRSAVGLRFAPGQAPAILRVSAGDLVGRQVDLDGVMTPSAFSALADACSEAEQMGPGRIGVVLEAAFEHLAIETHDPMRAAIVSMSAAGLAISEVAKRIGFSNRQLQRRSVHLFGYGPKHLAAVLRFQRAIGLSMTGASAAAVASASGYVDQSHLVRDSRRFAGMPFGALLRERTQSVGQVPSGA